jgi:hypothetical protein
MGRRFALFGMLLLITAAVHAQQGDESFEVEPALLPQNLKNDLLASKSTEPAPVLDVVKLEKDLERAKKNAAGAERLFKMGALAKVEVESRALRVVRLESDLENARLAHAKDEALAQKSEADSDETALANATQIEKDLARAIQAAHAAAAKREQAELEAAAMNLFRQQKLLALGSGSKSSVRRAEEKLAQVQEKNQ